MTGEGRLRLLRRLWGAEGGQAFGPRSEELRQSSKERTVGVPFSEGGKG